VGVPAGLARSEEDLTQIESEGELGDSIDVAKELLHLMHDLVLVLSGEVLQLRRLADVAEEQVVLAVFWLVQLFGKKSKVVFGRSQEDDGVDVRHQFAVRRVDSLKQIHFFLQNFGLRMNKRNNSHLKGEKKKVNENERR
jgi:hypothetical protein